MAKYNYFARGMDQLLFNDEIRNNNNNGDQEVMIEFVDHDNNNNNNNKCISNYCLLMNRKALLTLCVLVDTCRFFVIFSKIIHFKLNIYFLILFIPSILLYIHFIIIYILLYLELPSDQRLILPSNIIWWLFSMIYYFIGILPFSLFYCTAHFVIVCEGSDYGINRIFKISANDDTAQQIIEKLTEYLLNNTMFDQLIISMNYYLYLLLEKPINHRIKLIEEKYEFYINYIEKIDSNCNINNEFIMDSSLKTLRKMALEMQHSSKFDVIKYVWFNWLKSSMFCRYNRYKRDEINGNINILNKIEYDSNWFLISSFVVNLFVNKLWIILLPSILYILQILQIESISLSFDPLYFLVLILDINILIVVVKYYIPFCYKLFHILPLTKFRTTLKYINWNKYIIDNNYNDIIYHIEEIYDVLFIEKERHKMVYNYLYGNVASIIIEYAKTELSHLSFLQSIDHQCNENTLIIVD